MIGQFDLMNEFKAKNPEHKMSLTKGTVYSAISYFFKRALRSSFSCFKSAFSKVSVQNCNCYFRFC